MSAATGTGVTEGIGVDVGGGLVVGPMVLLAAGGGPVGPGEVAAAAWPDGLPHAAARTTVTRAKLRADRTRA